MEGQGGVGDEVDPGANQLPLRSHRITGEGMFREVGFIESSG